MSMVEATVIMLNTSIEKLLRVFMLKTLTQTKAYSTVNMMDLWDFVAHVAAIEEERTVVVDEINVLKIHNKSLTNQFSILEEGRGIVYSTLPRAYNI